jgi:dihydrofolate reductase
MKLSLIVAMAQNRVIGQNKQMPWHLSADLKKFKQITMGSPIIMGRKTFEAIGRPLPGRENIIVSRNRDYTVENCTVCLSVDEAINRCCQQDREVFVIGGATLYQQTMQQADRLYLTQIHRDFVGDTYFPEIDQSQWMIQEQSIVENDPDVDFSYSFIVMEKKVDSDNEYHFDHVGC